MEDLNINRTGIVILQWLRNEDPQLGEELYFQIRNKETQFDNFFVTFYKATNQKEFTDSLQKMIDTLEEGTIFTLHIVAHGYEDGLGTDLSTSIKWKELFYYTRQLNIKMHNTLLIVLSSCVGGGILSYIDPTQRAPYMAFIGNTRDVLIKDARKGFPLFYEGYRSPLDFVKGLKALNESIDFSEELEPGKRKTEFFIMSAAQSFDEIFNPDRDPIFFAKVVSKIMPPNQIIPQELRIQKAKELFKRSSIN